MTDKTPHSPGQPPAALVKAIRKLLRPLVRLMLSYQITYPYLINLLKSLYVEVAEQDFPVDNKRPSDSRINLLTGVHRKDVKRLRAELAEPERIPATISIGAQLIAHWLGAEDFLDPDNRPRPLPLRGAGPQETSFDDLVERVCKQDIRPRVILDEWLNLDIAHIDEQDRVVLNTGAFTPQKGFDEKAFFLGKNIHDHISAGAHNLLGRTPSHFDRSVYYDRLSAQSTEELSRLADEAGMQALRTVNSEAMRLQKRDADQELTAQTGKPETYRINFGIFNYNTPYDATPQSETTKCTAERKGDTDA